MKQMFLKARIQNMTKEFVRLTGFMFSPHHISIQFNLLGEHKTIPTSDGYLLRDEHTGELYLHKVDTFDRVLDVVTDFFKTYWRNVVVQCNCTHPHEHVHEEWEGDREYGYYRQLYCSKCQGYLGDEDIDQYRVERNVTGYHPGFRPQGWYDAEEVDNEVDSQYDWRDEEYCH